MSSSLSSGLCRRLKFSTKIDGYALHVHVIKTFHLYVYVGPSVRSACTHRCIMDPMCVSVNIGPPTDEKFICELSDSDHMKHPEDLKKREGYLYIGSEVNNFSVQKIHFHDFWWKQTTKKHNLTNRNLIMQTLFSSRQNPCFSNPCRRDSICMNGYTDKQYLCKCQAGYTGEQCEKGEANRVYEWYYYLTRFINSVLLKVENLVLVQFLANVVWTDLDTREFKLISLNICMRILSYVISFVFFVFLFNIVSFACFFALNIYVNLGLSRSLQEDFFVFQYSVFNVGWNQIVGTFFEAFEDIRTEEDRWTCL